MKEKNKLILVHHDRFSGKSYYRTKGDIERDPYSKYKLVQYDRFTGKKWYERED